MTRACTEWHDSGVHLVERSTVDMPEAPDGISIMGCDAANNTYIRLHSDEHGICRIYQMSINESEWKLWREGEPFPQPLGRRGYGSAAGGLVTASGTACGDRIALASSVLVIVSVAVRGSAGGTAPARFAAGACVCERAQCGHVRGVGKTGSHRRRGAAVPTDVWLSSYALDPTLPLTGRREPPACWPSGAGQRPREPDSGCRMARREQRRRARRGVRLPWRPANGTSGPGRGQRRRAPRR